MEVAVVTWIRVVNCGSIGRLLVFRALGLGLHLRV